MVVNGLIKIIKVTIFLDFQAVRVYRSSDLEIKFFRMTTAEVKVIDTVKSVTQICGRITVIDHKTAESRIHTIPCNMACGEEIELSVHRDSLKSGIHVTEIEALRYGE